MLSIPWKMMTISTGGALDCFTFSTDADIRSDVFMIFEPISPFWLPHFRLQSSRI